MNLLEDKLLALCDRWGDFKAPMLCAGMTNAERVTCENLLRHGAEPRDTARLLSLADAALSWGVAEPSHLAALLSTKIPGTTRNVAPGMVLAAIAADWGIKAPHHHYLKDHATWAKPYTPGQIRACLSAKRSLEKVARATKAYEIAMAEVADSPSPTLQRGAKNPLNAVFGGNGPLGGVGAFILCLLFWLPSQAQVAPLTPGVYTVLHIVHGPAFADTVTTTVNVDKWQKGTNGNFCIMTRLDGPDKGVKCLWIHDWQGVIWNNRIPVTPQGAGWWYSKKVGADTLPVEIQFFKKP